MEGPQGGAWRGSRPAGPSLSPREAAREVPWILAYPHGGPDEAARVAEELELLGVEDLYFVGEVSLGNVRLLGKGKSSIVLECSIGGRRAAVKIRRLDAPVPDLALEASMLRIANSAGVGPRLLAWGRDAIVMELLRGMPLEEFLRSEASPEMRVRAVAAALDKARALDRAHLDHGELHDPGSHVLATRDGAEIIDFGSASSSRRPSNVTSLGGAIARMIGLRPQGRLLESLRRYKREMSEEAYADVVESLVGAILL